METKVNLVEILKDAPKGLKLWCDVLGDVTLGEIDKNREIFPIGINGANLSMSVTKTGAFHIAGEGDTGDIYPCVLWPCESHRSWENWQVILFNVGDIIVCDDEVLRYNGAGDVANLTLCRWATKEEREEFLARMEMAQSDFKPFDKVLVRDDDTDLWTLDFFEKMDENGKYVGICCNWWGQCLHYEGNEHLLNTDKKP